MVLLIASAAWLVLRALHVAEGVAFSRLPGQTRADGRVRRARTQIRPVRRLASIAVTVAAIGLILTTFPPLRTIGLSVLTSAGAIGALLGLSARTALGNAFAGIQVAFADGLQVGDVIVIDGQWGRVEEVKLTNVVIRLWDDRMLILPTHLLHRTLPKLDPARDAGGRPGPDPRRSHRRPGRPPCRDEAARRIVTAVGSAPVGATDGGRDAPDRRRPDPGIGGRRSECVDLRCDLREMLVPGRNQVYLREAVKALAPAEQPPPHRPGALPRAPDLVHLAQQEQIIRELFVQLLNSSAAQLPALAKRDQAGQLSGGADRVDDLGLLAGQIARMAG
ncbi:mechanosensitive ion channel family protein [Micromonospora globbae]|uniref:mechanosensitive ion channel family protein n=1 Tax=Micromonospora globbae TaxID=1894969 RepID=UPI00341563F8